MTQTALGAAAALLVAWHLVLAVSWSSAAGQPHSGPARNKHRRPRLHALQAPAVPSVAWVLRATAQHHSMERWVAGRSAIWRGGLASSHRVRADPKRRHGWRERAQDQRTVLKSLRQEAVSLEICPDGEQKQQGADRGELTHKVEDVEGLALERVEEGAQQQEAERDHGGDEDLSRRARRDEDDEAGQRELAEELFQLPPPLVWLVDVV
eukprot:1115515-Prymnesium_polylepis.13